MATTLQIVDTDLSTVLFDFNDSTGLANPGAVKTMFGVGGALQLTPGDTEFVTLSPKALPGGSVVSRRDPLGDISWRQRFYGVTADNMTLGIGTLSSLIAAGGILKIVLHGSSETRYAYFEPSVTPILHNGVGMGLWQVLQLNDTPEGVGIGLTIQPYLTGTTLAGSLNLVNNGTLTHDFGGTANRPDGWTWTGTTGLSAETITQSSVGGIRRGVYQFAKADGTAASLQFTTADSTYASGDVGVFSFYARVNAVAGTPQMQATLQFQTNAAANVGGLHSGGLVTLTTAWQRISVTSTAAGATTGQALVSIQIDNADATSVVVQVCNAQAEKTAATGFRVAPEVVAFDPASAVIARRLAVWAEGTAPTTGRVKVTADAQTLGEVRVYRETTNAVAALKQTTHKQLESGTLGTGTTSTADGNASGGNTAQVVYPATSPAFGTDVGVDAVASSVTVTKPASTAAGDVLVAVIGAFSTSGSASTFSTIPTAWAVAGSQSGASTTSLTGVFYKVAGASEPASYTWTNTEAGSSPVGHGWIGRFTNIDTAHPLDTISIQDNSGTPSATINVPSVTTAHDNNRVIEFSVGHVLTGVGFTHTPSAGATPTYTEEHDINVTNGSNVLGITVADGNLATAGSTGTKTIAASAGTPRTVAGQIVLNKLPSVFEARSTVTWTGITAGDYDVWLRFYPTAASVQRLEVEWAPVASPSTWFSMGEVVVDTSNASAFAYVYRKMGRIHIPPEWPLSTLTMRINTGQDTDTASNLRLDFVDLVPVNEMAATLEAPASVASGASLVGDPDVGRAFHLDSSGNLIAIGSAHGAIPVPLEPGYNMLTLIFRQQVATGFVDRAGVLTASPTVAVDVVPRYR